MTIAYQRLSLIINCRARRNRHSLVLLSFIVCCSSYSSWNGAILFIQLLLLLIALHKYWQCFTNQRIKYKTPYMIFKWAPKNSRQLRLQVKSNQPRKRFFAFKLRNHFKQFYLTIFQQFLLKVGAVWRCLTWSLASFKEMLCSCSEKINDEKMS